jgi:solute carrier family 25 (mitochondrial S-adenosylmethionine transporter), member 26
LGSNLSLPIQHFFAASIAEASQAIVRNPFEVIKQNQQIGKYNTILEAISHIYSKKGISGFYSGYFSLVGREIPFSGLQFPLYEWFKRLQISYLAKRKNCRESEVQMNFWNNSLNGCLAGSIAGYIVTPVDVIKTRLMTRDLNMKNQSVKEIVVQILKEDGIPGLYRGATMRLLYLSFGG